MDKKKLKQLADYAVTEGLEHSEDGRWAVSYEELLYHFGVDVSDINENGKLLEEELRQREEINELIMTEDCIEMTYHLEYCENCQDDPASLLSVLGCNLTEDHFDHGPVQSTLQRWPWTSPPKRCQQMRMASGLRNWMKCPTGGNCGHTDR